MSRDRLAEEVASRNRPHRSLALLRELYRLKTRDGCEMVASAASEEWREVWRQVRELLAEEVPGTETKP